MTIFLLAMVVAADPQPTQAELLQIFRDEFVPISPGVGDFPRRFAMGRRAGSDVERPVHEVEFAYAFEVAKYEVPQNLWEAVMGTNPSRWKGKRNSVEMLSFDEAVEFCRKSTKLMQEAGLITAVQVIRLPSEAEWEYVARVRQPSTRSVTR